MWLLLILGELCCYWYRLPALCLLSVQKHGRLAKLQTWTKNGLNMSNLNRHLQNIRDTNDTPEKHLLFVCLLENFWLVYYGQMLVFAIFTTKSVQHIVTFLISNRGMPIGSKTLLLFSQFDTLSSARPAIDVCETSQYFLFLFYSKVQPYQVVWQAKLMNEIGGLGI